MSYHIWYRASVSCWIFHSALQHCLRYINISAVHSWIQVWGMGGPVSGISVLMIQVVLTNPDHISLGVVLHQEECRAHCTSIRSEDFIPVLMARISRSV